MAHSRKSRSINKRFSTVRVATSSKDKITENASKNRLKVSPGIQKVKQRKIFCLCSLLFLLESSCQEVIIIFFQHFVNVYLGIEKSLVNLVRHYGFYFLTYNCFLNFNDLQKRKLIDMLGPQWNKKELEHFYEAYSKYGKDWKKVSSSLVIRCFLLNKGYRSNFTIKFLSQIRILQTL